MNTKYYERKLSRTLRVTEVVFSGEEKILLPGFLLYRDVVKQPLYNKLKDNKNVVSIQWKKVRAEMLLENYLNSENTGISEIEFVQQLYLKN